MGGFLLGGRLLSIILWCKVRRLSMRTIMKTIVLLGVILLTCNGLYGCRGGETQLLFDGNPFSGNSNLGIVHVTLDLPFDLPKGDIEVTPGLSYIQPDGDGYIVEVAPGYSQLVWATCEGRLIGMAVIIDSAQVNEITINARSTIASLLFLSPFVAKADLEYDRPTWRFINSIPSLGSLANRLSEIMQERGIRYLEYLGSDAEFLSGFNSALLALFECEPVRTANGNNVDPEGMIKGLELVDNTNTQDEPNDFIVLNYWHRYAKVVYPSPAGVDTYKFLEPGSKANPNKETIVVDYGDENKKDVVAYTIAIKGLTKIKAKDIPHLVHIWLKNIACGVGIPILKIILGPGVVFVESAYCDCGTDLLMAYGELHPDEFDNLMYLILDGQVLKAAALGVRILGQAVIDDWDAKGWESCLGKTIQNVGEAEMLTILDTIGQLIKLAIGTIISGLKSIPEIVKLGIACFQGQAVTKWTVTPSQGEPHIVKTVETPGWAFGVVLSSGYAYVADDAYGLQIIDIDPIDSAYIVKTVDTPCAAVAVAISGGYAYVADFDAHLLIIDTDPIDSASIVKTVNTMGSARGVAVSDGYAYVADADSGLQIIDIDPVDLASIIKTVDTPGDALGVAVSCGYAYVTDGYEGFHIIDIDPIDSASIIKTVDTPGFVSAIAVSGLYAYVGDVYYGSFHIIDIDPIDSANIVKTIDTPDHVEDVAISGEYAYVANDSYGLRIIDIEPINSAFIVETVDTPKYAVGVAVSGGHAYIADREAGLHIIDLAGYY
jgi:hypothetical protein